MLNWFREMSQELRGIDSSAAKKIRTAEDAEKRKITFIIPKNIKVMMIVVGLGYLITTGFLIAALHEDRTDTVPQIIKSVIMCVLDIGVIFALLIGKKKGEIIALSLSFLFLVGLFISITLVR